MPGCFARALAVLLAIASLALAGCQSTGAPPRNEAAGLPDPGIYGEAQVREAVQAYSRAVADHCSIAGGAIGCYQQTLLTSFASQSPAAARECTLDMDYDPFFDCVMFGSTAERILGNLSTAAAGAMDWGDPRGSFDGAIDLAAARVKEKCPTEYRSCVGPETARVLGLETAVGERCASRGGASLANAWRARS